MTNGDLVIVTASKCLGERETAGPNRSAFIDMLNARFGLVGTPWCSTFVAWVYSEAGVDIGGIASSSTAEMCRRAREKGYVWDGRSAIPSGAIWVACGRHTGLLNTPLGGGVYSTIEGNHGDSVSTGERSVADGLIIIPPALRGPAPPPLRTFWLEDTAAQPKLYGPWADRDVRNRKLASIPAARRRRARLVNHRDDKRWAWIEGGRRLYGPWSSQDARDAAREALGHRLGHQLRAFSREVSDGT